MFTKSKVFLSSLFTIVLMFMAVVFGADTIRVSAGAAPTENIFKKIQAPMEKSLGIKLICTPCGPVQALKDLDQGKADAAAGGVAFQDWMDMMEKEGYKIADRTVYKNRVIGRDIIKTAINKDILVKTLTKEQLKDIFTGKIVNWKEVGGPNLQIVVVLGKNIPGTQSVFQKQIMDGVDYKKIILEGTTAEDVKSKVIAIKGAIGLIPLSIADTTINSPEIPVIGRPIVLITKQAPPPAMEKMIEFIAGDGKKYLTK